MKYKEHIIYFALLLILLVLFFYKTIYLLDKSPWCETIASYMPRAEILKQSIFEYGDFVPLWNPYMMSGMPFLPNPDARGIFTLWGVLLMITRNAFITVKITALLEIFLAGISMYILVYYLLKKNNVAFLSAIVYMFNGWTILRYNMCHWSSITGYPFVPLILLFVILAFKNKGWVKYSIIGGILLALQMLAGPALFSTLWTLPIITLYLMVSSLDSNFMKRIIKSFLILILVLTIAFGLTAMSLLPIKEYVEGSSRQSVSSEMASARKVSLNNMFTQLVEPIYKGMPQVHRQFGSNHIGIFAFLLLCFAVYKKWKNKNVMFFTALIVFSLFIATGSFVFQLIRLLPGYASFRYLDRTLVMYVFAGAVLIGYGFYELIEYLNRKTWKSRNINLVVYSVISLIIIDLMVFGSNPYRDTGFESPQKMLEDNHILQNISLREGIFRIHAYETRGIDWNTEFQNIPLHMSQIYGYVGAWNVEYMNEYLGVANSQPAKFWGILNVKYITAQNKLNITGFKYLDEFKPCKICFPQLELLQKIWGPYLYENGLFLPKVYIVNNSILVVGEKDAAKQAMYAIMLNENFNPANTAIILGKTKIDDYGLEEMKQYNAIFLTRGSIDQTSIYKLRSYSEAGGIILPNVVENKNDVTRDEIDNILSTFKSKPILIEDKNVIMHNFDDREVITKYSKNGFLVYSETFSLYSGWAAKVNGKTEEILRANGVVSAVAVDPNTNNVTFKYKPQPYVVGSLITIFTILALCAYFVVSVIKKRGKNKIDSSDT